MSSLATKSATLTAIATGETDAALELQREAAVDSEEGIEMQSESIELEASSEREIAEATEQTLIAEKYKEQAETLHEQSVKDKMESESSFEKAEELEASSKQAYIEAGQDLAAAETYQEQSVFDFDEAAKAEQLATNAEVQAAKDETIVLEKEAASAKDAESLVKTESSAAEDAEAIAVCEVVPFLNVLCDIAGAITEGGLQAIAAVEASKSAIESIAAATWSGKEKQELLVASEEHAEAAKFIAEGEKFESLSVESGERAQVEEAKSSSLEKLGLNAQSIGEDKLIASKEEETLSKLDEEESTRHYAEALEHEFLAAEEEEASIATQVESEERLEQSTAEEFESQSERLDAESKENKARKLLEQSIDHGMKALLYVTSSIMTAVAVVYVLAMKTLTKRVAPSVANFWTNEHRWTGFDTLRLAFEALLHAAFILVVIVSSQSSLLHFGDLSTLDRWKELVYLAVLVGAIESSLIHCLPMACCCWVQSPTNSLIVDTTTEFFGMLVQITPVVFVELLIILTWFGPIVINNPVLLQRDSMWTWGAVLLLFVVYILYFRLASVQIIESPSNSNGSSCKSHLSTSSGWEEDHFSHDQGHANDSLIGTTVDKEYGSMEEVSLLASTKQPSDVIGTNSAYKMKIATSGLTIQKLKKGWQRLFEVLHLRFDLLAFSLVVMILYHWSAVIKVLQPIAITSYTTLGHLFSTRALFAGIVAVVAAVHFTFVR
jgi:hypothetical protein